MFGGEMDRERKIFTVHSYTRKSGAIPNNNQPTRGTNRRNIEKILKSWGTTRFNKSNIKMGFF
jgi:hypothetical protein